MYEYERNHLNLTLVALRRAVDSIKKKVLHEFGHSLSGLLWTQPATLG